MKRVLSHRMHNDAVFYCFYSFKCRDGVALKTIEALMMQPCFDSVLGHLLKCRFTNFTHEDLLTCHEGFLSVKQLCQLICGSNYNPHDVIGVMMSSGLCRTGLEA